jgi:hypothetical protein
MMKKQTWRVRRSSWIVLVAFSLCSTHLLADCTAAPSDTTFSVYDNSGSGYGNDPGTPGAPTIYKISRVVGPGTAGEFDGGFLTDSAWQTYVANGVLSRFASLYISATQFGDGGIFPQFDGSFQVIVNGHVATEQIHVGNGFFGCVDILTKYLKFPLRGQNGNPPEAAENQVTFTYSNGLALQDHEALIGSGNLSIQAMAPIVLVHGWNGGPWDWAPMTNSPCPANPSQTNTKGELNFVQSFIDLHAPFDCSIVIRSQAVLDEGALSLQSQLPGILTSFGTQHVNLIAHSKGGLYMREFLQLNEKVDTIKQIGVVSATTLDTPHRGSVLATTVAHFNTFLLSAEVIELARKAGLTLGFLGKGANDMTPKGLADFNQRFPTPPDHFYLSDPDGNSFTTNPQYFSTSADADQNENGIISGTEADPPYSSLFANFGYQLLARNQPVITVTNAGLLAISSVPRAPTNYFLNDCIVPIFSAQYPGFQEIGSFQGVIGRNHGTIRKPDIAALVFTKIQIAEGMQP